jgi:hypothetical protein
LATTDDYDIFSNYYIALGYNVREALKLK